MVSMALSDKRCCLPLFLVVSGFQDLMTDGDIHSVKEPLLHKDCSYSFQLVTLYFFLYFGLRLLLCSSFITFLHFNKECNTPNLFMHQSQKNCFIYTQKTKNLNINSLFTYYNFIQVSKCHNEIFLH